MFDHESESHAAHLEQQVAISVSPLFTLPYPSGQSGKDLSSNELSMNHASSGRRKLKIAPLDGQPPPRGETVVSKKEEHRE